MKRAFFLFAIIITALFLVHVASPTNLVFAIDPPVPTFERGDANDDTNVDMSDIFWINNYANYGGPAPNCKDAADVNDDGSIDNQDIVYLLNWLYNGGSAPPSPGPFVCGPDPTSDSLDCNGSYACD